MEPQRFISYLSSLFRNRSKFWFIPDVLTIDFEKLRLRVLVLKQEKRKKTQRHRGHVGGKWIHVLMQSSDPISK